MNSKNKKLLVIIAIVLVFFVVFFIFYKYKSNSKLNYISPEENETTQELVQRINLIDTDGDGLKDWEEVLWKTDPNNPDTDEDGMNDNEEILNQRDPLVKGEGDLNNKITQINSFSENTKTTLNQTDILAREIFTGYVALKQNNALGTIEQEDFIEKITSANLNLEQNIQYLTLNDIKVISDSSKKTLQKYADELKKVFSENPTLRDDNVILKEALDNEDPKILDEIKSNTIFYKKFTDNLIGLEVPNELKNYHLDLINLFKQMTENTKQMIQVFEDPILGLVGAKSYSETTNKIINTSVELGKYFKEKNINF